MDSSNNMINQKHETRHIIAILDLLGASKMIMGNNSENVMNAIFDMFKSAETVWPYLKFLPIVLHNIKCVTFSDNIALALELPNSMSKDELRSVIKDFIAYISVLQGVSLKNGFLFRGGISIGQLYMDSSTNFVWGKALVEAHQLEEKTAIYPRIVLSQQLEQFELPDTTKVLKDFDGIYFVDYLSTIKKVYPEWIDKNKKIIQRKYVEHAGEERVLQKYGWLQHYIDKVD